MKKFIYICTAIFPVMFLTECQKHDINNPFDSECPKELWTPSGLTASQQGTSVLLSWTQANQHISGFRIERKVGSGSFTNAGTIAKGTTAWSDTDLKAGQLHEYRVCAYAGNNQSNIITAQITPTLPSSVTTTTVTSILCNSAVTGGTVSSDGGSAVTARGVCWNTTGNPTIANNPTTNGPGTGSFTAILSGLSEKTMYYVRAYATNSVETSYGNQVSFTTPACITGPTVLTTAVTGITPISATSGGNVTSDGGAAVTARGVCWNTSKTPTINNNKTINGSGTGAFTGSMTGLTANTVYYVRAYATNSVTTSYGDETSFSTFNPASKTYSITGSATNWTTDVDFTYVSTSGTVSAYIITSRNFIQDEQFKVRVSHKWDENYGYNNMTITGETSNIHSVGSDGNIATLSERTYEIRLYVDWTTNVHTLQMNNLTPSVTTAAVTSVATTSCVSGGNIVNAGASAITARGVCWSTATMPAVTGNRTSNGAGVGSYSSNITGLTGSTVYYLRAYATNSYGTSYGMQVTFPTLPDVTTTSLSDVRLGCCTTGGTVAYGGGVGVTARGVCWATTAYPDINDNTLPGGSGTGTFCNTITGLSCSGSANYYIRAFATNSSGTAYGPQLTFNTSPCLAILASLKVASVNINPQTATVGSNVAIQATLAATTIISTRVGIYLSKNNKFDPCNDTFIREVIVNFSSGSASINQFFTVPAGFSGTYYIFCVADNTWNLAVNGARADDVMGNYFSVK